jgi:hypothetical protein
MQLLESFKLWAGCVLARGLTEAVADAEVVLEEERGAAGTEVALGHDGDTVTYKITSKSENSF